MKYKFYLMNNKFAMMKLKMKRLSNQSLERNHHYYRRMKNDDNIFNKMVHVN